ncbi:hypothetical protein BDV98DRAFT_556928, partial [Pterulicium gracile]
VTILRPLYTSHHNKTILFCHVDSGWSVEDIARSHPGFKDTGMNYPTFGTNPHASKVHGRLYYELRKVKRWKVSEERWLRR